MATLYELKKALRNEASMSAPSTRLPLTDAQYDLGFRNFSCGQGRKAYQDFIIPELTRLLIPLFSSRMHVSVLEIGPGPASLFEHLPHDLRRKIKRYTAFEPNELFAAKLEKSLCDGARTDHPLPHLEIQADIRRLPFVPDDCGERSGSGPGAYDVVLFCHSMYGMNPKHRFIETALKMLAGPPTPAIVIVFHRDGVLDFNDLVCHHTVSYPTGAVCVMDSDSEIDDFASFIAGHAVQTEEVRVKWRKMCRDMGRREKNGQECLWFRSPEVMVTFNRYASQMSRLMEQVPYLKDNKAIIKNREAQAHRPAAVFRPTELQHIQQCIRWAIEHEFGLTVIGGGHSGHCIQSNVFSIDMSAFNRILVPTSGKENSLNVSPDDDSRVFIEAGCKTGNVIRETMKVGVTLPLGSRPSVGAGLWLQGGIGHLSRLYGLASDAIVGAVIVSVDSAQVFCVGQVSSEYWPIGAIRPPNELDLLWAIKGAGTNFGVVVGVCCTLSKAPTFLTQDWIVPIIDKLEAQQKLKDFDTLVAKQLPSNCSADAYLYCDDGRLHLGVSLIKACTSSSESQIISTQLNTLLGPGSDVRALNSIELFDVDLYMSKMHGGQAGGKTSSFKRCLFLQDIGRSKVVDLLSAALEDLPAPLCYFHLIQGGGAVDDTAAKATAFGCRGWDFACVITAVWPRNPDGTDLAQSAKDWVYSVVHDLSPLSIGAYSADLGPDPRDAPLVARAFGPNFGRLTRIKHDCDPHNVLAYACPIPKVKAPQVIILVTGKSCAGKDYCADVWASSLARCLSETFVVKVASISDVTKQEYASATGADLSRLRHDRAYKERHRPALSKFFQDQMQKQPDLPKEHFLNAAYGTEDVDVLFITGMRDEAPVATMSHLVPNSRMLDINVQLDENTRRIRRGCREQDDDDNIKCRTDEGDPTTVSYQPCLTFSNDSTGKEEAGRFAERRLLPLFHEDLQRLREMIPLMTNFPSLGVNFRHVLGISQQSDGLMLCTSLLQEHFFRDWSDIGFVAACESGGFIYASALALQVKLPMITIREAGKLPPPTLSVYKSSSHIKSLASTTSAMKQIEMQRDAIPSGASVVVVDDVLATGKTLCAVLKLLDTAGVSAENVSVLVVAEFPLHGGRKLLYEHGFGRTIVQSLLVFDGA